MKTLPSNISTSKGISSKPIYLIRLIPKSGDSWSELRWASMDVTITGWGAFLGGRIAKGGLPTLEQSFDWFKGGGVAQMGNFSIKLLNQDKYQDTLGIGEGTNHYENRLLNTYIVFYTGSALSTSDCLLLQSGAVQQVSYDLEHITFDCVDAKQFDFKDIATDKIATRHAPQGNDGKVIPLVYGTLYSGDDHYNNENKMPLLKRNKAKDEYVVSQNECKEIVTIGAYAKISLYDSGANCHVRVKWGTAGSPQETITYGRPTKLEFSRDYPILAQMIKQFESMGDQTSPNTIDGSDAIDALENSYTSLGNSQKLYFKIKVPDNLFDIVSDTNIAMVVKFGTVSGDGTGYVKYYNPNYDDGVGGFSNGGSFNSSQSGSIKTYYVAGQGVDNSAHGKDPLQGDAGDLWTADEINTYQWGIELPSNLTAQIKQVYFYIGFAVVRKQGIMGIPKGAKAPRRRRGDSWKRTVVPDVEKVFDTVTVKVKGAKFGSWITESGRSCGYAADDLIENPAYIIEEILRTECGWATADIDTASFDLIGNTTDGTRKTLTMAGIVPETRNVLDVIDEICGEAHIILCIDYEGKAKLIDIYNPAGTARELNLFLLTNPKSGRSSFEVKLSPPDDIYTEFFLNYKKNFTAGNFDGSAFVRSSGSNYYPGSYIAQYARCVSAKSNYKKEKSLTMDCNWIEDLGASGENISLLLTMLTAHHTRQRHIYEWATTLEALDIELGDKVTANNPLLSSGLPDKDSMITSVKVNCNKSEIHLRAVEYEY